MIELKSKSEFDKFVQNKGAVVQFSTTWCNPCKMLKPHMEKVSDTIHEPVAFIYVDTAEEGRELQSEFDINSVPQIMRFDNAKNEYFNDVKVILDYEKSIFDVEPKDIKLENYKHMGIIRAPIAV